MVKRAIPSQVERVGIAGAGVIGAGWAAHFLRRGMDVVAYDPAPDMERGLRDTVAELWPTMERLGLAAGASPDRLTIADSPAHLARGVQVIQENAPERAWTPRSRSSLCWTRLRRPRWCCSPARPGSP